MELAKARLTALVLATTVVGFLAAGGRVGSGLLAAVLGTGLAAAGANVLNQWLERRPDALMRRTRGRPLPARRVAPPAALRLGLAASAAGVGLLALLSGPLPSALAALVVLLYTLVYTPLKRRTPACTLVGAVCGAVPPLIGWTAAGGRLGPAAWLLATVLFVWQIPHFLSLAWLHRRDYERGGFRMLPVVDPTGDLTCRSLLLFTGALPALVAAILLVGLAGPMFAAGGLVLSVFWLTAGLRLWRRRSEAAARRVFLGSLAYLPLLLGLMLADRGPWLERAGPLPPAVAPALAGDVVPDWKGGAQMAIDPELLEILVCPESKAPLVLDGETLVSTDPQTRRRYRIEDDIPIMLIDESEVLPEDEWRAVMERHGAQPFQR